MNAETMQRLLIDRSLGLLPNDVEALLDAHLAIDSEAAALAAQFDRTAALARRALAGGPASELPPFPAESVRREGRSLRRWMWTRNITAAAATLVIGFGLGAALFRNAADLDASGKALGGLPAAIVGTSPVSPRSAGMWSTRRALERATRAPEKTAARLIWDSPVRKPRLGDA